jgi:hypothetical protein
MSELKLKPGTYYRTRDGRKAYVAGLSPFESTNAFEGAAGYIEGEMGVRTWSRSGLYTAQRSRSASDLVEEWREPLERYCVVVRHDEGDQQFATENFRSRPLQSQVPPGARVIKWREVEET